jgi:catechol 2,3-dioxygenase
VNDAATPDFMIRRAGHVVLRVTDPHRARAFLEAVVGFQTFGQVGEAFFFMTAHPVSNHHMIAIRGGKPGERLPDPEHQIGMISIAYEVVDLEELRRLYGRIAADGPAYGVQILGTDDRGHVEGFTCADRDGNRLEFYRTLAAGEAAGRAPYVRRGDLGDKLATPVAGATRIGALKVGIRRTSHLTLRCADLATTRDFYRDAVRLVPVANADDRVYLGSGPGRPPVLALEPAHAPTELRPTPRRMYGMEHFSLEVGSFDQLRNAYRALQARGIAIDHTVDHGVTNSLYLVDPDGNLIEIYHDVPRGEYRTPEDPFAAGGEGLEERLLRR